jgi:hypothetical protein
VRRGEAHDLDGAGGVRDDGDLKGSRIDEEEEQENVGRNRYIRSTNVVQLQLNPSPSKNLPHASAPQNKGKTHKVGRAAVHRKVPAVLSHPAPVTVPGDVARRHQGVNEVVAALELADL